MTSMITAKDNLTANIATSIKKAQKEEILFEEIFNNPDESKGKNEFLFFIKPEITTPSKTIKLEKILDLVLSKIESFGLKIHNVKTLSAKYLDEYNIIAQHYGVINKISSNAIANMSDSAKEKFIELYGKPVTELKVIGSSEFLEQYKHFNAYVLDYLWQNKVNVRLANGTYCEDIKIDEEIIYLINGFHPRQLKHFTEKGRSIVVMTLSGDLSWSEARKNFIGATNPVNALSGSLRREFLDKKDELGLADVSQGLNGVHLSAGPVEALVELKRYNSNFSDSTKIKSFDDFAFGSKLKVTFPLDTLEKITSNINLQINGASISVFDLTDGINSEDAIELLKTHFTH